MSVEIKNAQRVRLTGQRMKMGFLDVDGNPYSYDVDIDQYLGEGSSCICYEVTVYKNDRDLGQKRVLKQFYPDPRSYEIDTEMTGMSLEIRGYSEDREKSGYQEINRLGEFFENAFRRQAALSNKKELADVVVRPDLCHFDGATKYVLYESDYGHCLDWQRVGTAEAFIGRMYELAVSLQKLHGQGILYMDLKPSNILVSGSGKIKLFDFDASIDMGNLRDVHIKNDDIRYDVGHMELIAPELRPERLREFEQNKALILNERIDIYSLGAIMFSFLLGRYPAMSDCETPAYEKELAQVFNSRFRGELTEEEQKLLNHILWKCIQKDIGPGGRYECMEELARDLEELKDLTGAPIAKRRRVYNKVNGRLQAAYVMDKYPLAGYRRPSAGNEWVMDSLIIGNDPIGEDFFANIFACAQMLHTKSVLRLAVSSAEEKLREYTEKWPLLARTANLYINDVWMGNALDRQVTRTPFADIYFYEWTAGADIGKFYRSLKDHEKISWIVVSDSEPGHNMEMAQALAAGLEDGHGETFIAYLDERGDGYDLRMSDKSYENVVLFPFGCNDKHSLDEKDFEKGIRRQALLLHKYYMREWNERADRAEIWRDFSSEAYNVNSSLCSVLSIPYKLRSVGIKTTGSEAAAEFRKCVLETDSPSARKNLNHLIWLEHRRWMCFMVTEGYDRPEEKTVEQYAFRGKNDQRNKQDKLHPCLCDCDMDAGICLDRLPHNDWENASLKSLTEREEPLDELDTMSVRFHRLCARRIAQMKENGDFEAAFGDLERAMKAERFPACGSELLDSVKTIYQRMLDNESNINRLWRKTCAAFREAMEEHAKDVRIHTGEVSDAFRRLENLMRVVEERNSYHDYKSSDRTILEVLPLLLISDRPIRRIHKPAAEKTWQNIASALIMEPEQLYLYTDDRESLDPEVIKDFLIKERGLDMEEKDIVVKGMDDLRRLVVTERSVRSVLDITGLSAEETFRITQMENLKPLPVIAFRDGRIQSMNGQSEADHYGVLRRHLTVAETFRLHHASIHSDDSQNYMLGLASNYKKIWSAYLYMNSFRYRVLVETLNKVEAGHYWRLETGKQSDTVLVFEKKRVPGGMLQDAGVVRVLEEMARDQWIESGYALPGAGQIGMVSVRTGFEQVKEYLEKMFRILDRHPYMHRFSYFRTHREPLTERPSADPFYYIYDDTLVVDEILKERPIDAKNMSLKKVLETALCSLERARSGPEAAIIEKYEGDSDPLIEPVPQDASSFRMKFIYRSRSTKECLMKEGNILEAYVYHTIWENALVDDVKLNVAFTWDAEDPKDALEKGAITNEIDLICTRNMQTYFISCKQSMPVTAYLQEIRYFADYFGMDGKAILVTSNQRTSSQQKQNTANLISARSQKMHVYYIDREMMGDNISDMKQGNLSKYIQNIFNGKKDWKNISE